MNSLESKRTILLWQRIAKSAGTCVAFYTFYLETQDGLQSSDMELNALNTQAGMCTNWHAGGSMGTACQPRSQTHWPWQSRSEWTPSSPYRRVAYSRRATEKRGRERCSKRGFAHDVNVKRTRGSRPFVLAGCVWYFTGRLLMALVKKTSSQVLPMASRRSSVVMWLGDGALIDFKQILFRLVGY